jgi:hypothetical protein
MCKNCEIIFKKLIKIIKLEELNNIKNLENKLNEEKKKNLNFIKKEMIELNTNNEKKPTFYQLLKEQMEKNKLTSPCGRRFMNNEILKNYYLTLNYFISKKGFDILKGNQISPNIMLPSINCISRYKPAPIFDILDDESIKNFIEERKCKSFYFISLDDIEIVPKYERNSNYIYGGINRLSIKEFLESNLNDLRNNFSFHMCQIYLSCIFSGESIPICSFLRKTIQQKR